MLGIMSGCPNLRQQSAMNTEFLGIFDEKYREKTSNNTKYEYLTRNSVQNENNKKNF